MPKDRKPSEKQEKIVAAMRAAHAANGPGSQYTPSAIGQECGKGKGSPASDWAYPALKTLLRKGIVARGTRPGFYRLADAP